MSLGDARRMLHWNVVLEALRGADVDAETIALVDRARLANDMIQGIGEMLIAGADTKQVKNYVKIEMVGMLPPFERINVELVRPDGKTSHELRGILRDRLIAVRQRLAGAASGIPIDQEEIIRQIDDDLAAEAP